MFIEPDDDDNLSGSSQELQPLLLLLRCSDDNAHDHSGSLSSWAAVSATLDPLRRHWSVWKDLLFINAVLLISENSNGDAQRHFVITGTKESASFERRHKTVNYFEALKKKMCQSHP